MPEAPFRPTPDRKGVRDPNRLLQSAEGATNATAGGAAGGLTASAFGTHYVPSPPLFIWARITGRAEDIRGEIRTGCTYFTWEEMEDQHCEFTHRDGVSMKGEAATFFSIEGFFNTKIQPRWPAYEVNGCDVTANTIVQLWRGNGDYFLFLRPACMANESGASGGSGFSSGGDSGSGAGGGTGGGRGGPRL